METLYVVLMFGVTLSILGTLAEAIRAVRSKPIWEQNAIPVAFVERRTQNLPYVGVERRQSKVTQPAEQQPLVAQVQQRKAA